MSDSPFLPSAGVNKPNRLSEDDFVLEAAREQLSVAIIKAVKDVESGASGFLTDGRPVILFEAHSFWTLTEGAYGESNISSQTWDRSLYGEGGAHQYVRMQEAFKLDPEAALKSASWGLFQIMGSNYKECGFESIQSFAASMCKGESYHLSAFINFCNSGHLLEYLRTDPPQFESFARKYNGPGYKQTGYHIKLEAAWRKWLYTPNSTPNPGPRSKPALYASILYQGIHNSLDVQSLQEQLEGVGYKISVDGDFGPETLWAVTDFQRKHNLTVDGVAGAATRMELLSQQLNQPQPQPPSQVPVSPSQTPVQTPTPSPVEVPVSPSASASPPSTPAPAPAPAPQNPFDSVFASIAVDKLTGSVDPKVLVYMILRWLLTLLGGTAVGSYVLKEVGAIPDSVLWGIAGIVMSLLGLAWSWYQKQNQQNRLQETAKLSAALSQPVTPKSISAQ